MPERIFGHIPGYPPGSTFANRAELSAAGVHRPTQAGIGGSEKEGADSIVLSGGYEDDADQGDEILYTGQGGRDPATGKQVAHQPLNRGNLALAKSKLNRLPVRVIRGGNHTSIHSPTKGYRYDGLYFVEDYWQERGKSGYYVWRYRLLKAEDADLWVPSAFVQENKASYKAGLRRETRILRIVRDSAMAKQLKKLYDYHCQVCGRRLEGSAGPYVEAAHIRPLGRPHNGSDTLDNVLCLCPNHHILFDYGGFTIGDNFALHGIPGLLKVHRRHRIDPENLYYHQEHYFFLQDAGA